jgi:membrane protein DedA with SNARE-associated domain/rhodanese-related sulfurtransferase
MNAPAHAWWDFGYAGVFVCVFLEQAGVPLPAFPALLAAGALVAAGTLSLPACLIIAVVAGLAADNIWYGIGRCKGTHVLHLMCRLSWKPDGCVGRTKGLFSQHGSKTLVFAKFVPGLSVLAPPLAGITRVPFPRFILYDGVGTIIWALPPILVGAYFQKSYQALASQATSMMVYLPWICGTMILAVLAWRYVNRRLYLVALREGLRGAINPEELRRMMEEGRDLLVLDIRDEYEARANPRTIANSRWIPYPTLLKRIGELPPDKPIVVFCDCPQDHAASTVMRALKKAGLAQARPLLNGLKGWIERGFETVGLRIDPRRPGGHPLALGQPLLRE